MTGCCHNEHCAPAKTTGAPQWRRALWIALTINLAMFSIEIAAGVAADSASLQADALDFIGDSANCAISLMVSGLALTWRARAAFAKGATLMAFSLWVIAITVWHALFHAVPEAEVMGAIGLMAIAANGFVALLLYRFRTGDSNMRSVWICSRNDVIGNAAVLLAAAGVFGAGAGWPDIIVASIMALLGLSGGAEIMRHAARDQRTDSMPAVARAE
ncbi:Cation transporter [Methylocella tundrae]|uniref:Cation transporter n=1 Tax=Methylocella tundrae TaxID=227605 RepID=A0A8B6MC89_METTU|nr:cation transporter [Methylocella tundrae]VTZ28314.1 Cation transporter [Methylocella tundrae]VTZ52667.1 Cation transporter [Methylocella tundrae]